MSPCSRQHTASAVALPKLEQPGPKPGSTGVYSHSGTHPSNGNDCLQPWATKWLPAEDAVLVAMVTAAPCSQVNPRLSSLLVPPQPHSPFPGPQPLCSRAQILTELKCLSPSASSSQSLAFGLAHYLGSFTSQFHPSSSSRAGGATRRQAGLFA